MHFARTLLLASACVAAACSPEGPSTTKATSPEPDARAELAALLAREGFAALRMSEEELASLTEAAKASGWKELRADVFPERIRRFDGVSVRIEGWMIPGRVEGRKVLDFMLVRDNAACCFGASPKDDEWIQVVMAGGAHASYARYAKIAVEGVLSIGGPVLVEGLAPPALRMSATRCDVIEAPR
ncbi:MAG: DUF3299 domain-containing protein [Planctomycetes bacterium]|nr:DUF3299 domain-containing protein [Planctomycetota bacterium]